MSHNVKTIEKSVARNNILDRLFQAVGAAALVVLAFQDLLVHFVRAIYPLNFALAAGFMVFILYVILAPLFRK